MSRSSIIPFYLSFFVAAGAFASACGSGLSGSETEASYRLVDSWTGAGYTTFQEPFGIAVDQRNGNVIATDGRGGRVFVLDEEGRLVREIGSKGEDPGEFRRPTGVAIGPDGSIYVTDYDLDRVQKFSPQGDFLLQWGSPGEGDEEFSSPNGPAVDVDGTVYVADFYNRVVKVFDSEGRFLRRVGEPGQWRTGSLDYATGVAIAPQGTIFVADAYNYRIQLFAPDGAAEAAWGWHLFWLWPRPASGTEGFDVPTGVAVGRDGDRLHVADSANHRLVMLDSEGAVVDEWVIRDRASEYHTPSQVAVSPDGGRVYATDIANSRVAVLKIQTQEESR